MPFAPTDFQQIAEAVVSGSSVPNIEARHRTAAGRAYYAVFLATYEAIRLKYAIGGTKWPRHEDLAVALAHVQQPEIVRKLGNALLSLKQSRVNADYRLNQELNIADAQRVVRDAKAALAVLDQAKPLLPRVDPG